MQWFDTLQGHNYIRALLSFFLLSLSFPPFSSPFPLFFSFFPFSPLSPPPSVCLPPTLAQLGERQTKDLKVPGSIPGLGSSFSNFFSWFRET